MFLAATLVGTSIDGSETLSVYGKETAKTYSVGA